MRSFSPGASLRRRDGSRGGKKLPAYRSLMARVDRAHSLYIRERDRGVCVICGSAAQPECGHILTRAAHATRWDIELDGNCHCQCHLCNQAHEENAAPFMDWYLKKHGYAAYDALVRRHNKVKRWTIGELEDLLRAIG